MKMAEKTYRRGLILASAAVTGGVTGSIYMWSIFNKPLIAAYGWTPSEVSLAYSLFLLMVCLAGFVAGNLQKKVKPSMLVLIAGIGFSLGWFLTGFATTIPMLYLTFSVIGGISDGFIYNTAVSTATKWFPDKRGFANGICIGCMGLAPLIFAPLGNTLIEAFGAAGSFKICGAIFLVCYLIFAWFIKAPEPGWKPEGWTPTESQAKASAKSATTSQMLKSPLFWTLWLTFAAAASSGMMMTGHASGIGQQLAHLDAAQGALMVGILAVANFFGRFGFGSLSDKIGRYNTLFIILAITALDMLFGFAQASDFVSFMVVLCIVGLCFGGVMAIMPALCADSYGSENFGMNYAALYSGYTVASFIGPMLAANVLQSTGAYNLAFTVAGILSAVGLVLVFIAKKLATKQAAAETPAKKSEETA